MKLVLLLLCTIVIGYVRAQEAFSVQMLDKNKDGTLSLEEFITGEPGNAAFFRKHDKNGDKSLSKEEFSEFYADFKKDIPDLTETADAAMKRIDANGDGKVTEFEFGHVIAEMFNAMRTDFTTVDKDGNGQLTETEFAAFMTMPDPGQK